MRPTIIYGLHAGDGVIRYVGKTIGALDTRLRGHRTDAKRGSKLPVHRWMRKHGLPTIRILQLDRVAEGEAWQEIERTWIVALAGTGLLNLTKGGDGPGSYAMPAEQRAKIAAALANGRERPCEICGTPVYVTPFREARGHGRFCSRSCRAAHDRRKDYASRPAVPAAVQAAAAKRRAITHCPQGHPYSGDNLAMRAGRRHCRACGRAATARSRAKRLDRIVNAP